MRLTSLALVLTLAGCGSGCNGDRRKVLEPEHAEPPATPTVVAAPTPVIAAAGEPVAPPGPEFLDAPADSLDGLFTGLAAAERERADVRPPAASPGAPDPGRVLWLFFGDSHTAGDSMTSRLRVTLQHKFGDAGRGLVAAGKPNAKHYYQRDVHYGASGSWKAAVGGKKGDAEPFGIAGLRVFGQSKGAQLWVETCAECRAGTAASQLEILYYAAPDHGALKYRVDDQGWQALATRTSAIEPPHPARQVIVVPDGPHKLTLEHAGGGIVDLFGVVLERARPGVIVDSLGVVGRRLGSLRSWDWSVIGEQLASRDPRLVVLQYGTNEADDPDLDLEAMARYFDETILRIRAAAPTSSILILGPPDMATREAGKACDRMAKARAPGRGSKAPEADESPVIPECEWHTPHILTEIISVEHAAAARNKVAFFDTFAAMGGADHMHPWVIATPKVAFKDHVHLTNLGYQQWADALSTAVLAAYDHWRTAHHLPSSAAPSPLSPEPAPPPGAPPDADVPPPVSASP
jgi:lysophospholipase L1-like esterase